MIRFLHTADWQLGKPFAGIEEDHKRVLVQQERIEVIGRIGAEAQRFGAAFVLVAGDLFDSPTPTRSLVSAACAAIGRMELPVLAIPGNHDHGGPGGLWDQEFFQHERECLAPNLQVLLAPTPVELEGAMIFPCPLLRRAESVDPTEWLRDPAGFGVAGDRVRIVLAHGSTQGFGADGDEDDGAMTATNQIDLTRLSEGEVDYVALGDWHGMKEVAPKAWYSGTPEIDRFPKGGENRPGYILAVSASRGSLPSVKEIPTARLGWKHLEMDLAEDAAVAQLQGALDALLGSRAQQDLLRLDLSGSLGIEATTRLESLIERLAARLLRLKLTNRTVLAPTEEEITELTRRMEDPLIARVAGQLVETTLAGGEEAVIARMALRELHAACHDR